MEEVCHKMDNEEAWKERDILQEGDMECGTRKQKEAWCWEMWGSDGKRG